MSKHDLKAVKLQVERFTNKVLGSKIFSHNPIVYTSDDFDMSNPQTLITRAFGEANFGNGVPDISLWDGSPIDEGKYVTHIIDGAEYMFRSEVDENTSEPSLPSEVPSTWSLIGEVFNHALLPAPWSATPTPLNAIRWIAIDGVTYEFASTIEGNTSEPSLDEGGPAWTNLGFEGFPPSFNIGTNYSEGDFIRSTISLIQYTYKSKVNGNIDHQPVAETSDSFWEYIGVYRGFFPTNAPYVLNAVVLDPDSNVLFKSNVADNNYSLDAEISGSWLLLGPIPNLPLTFVNPTMPLVSEGIYSLSFNLPEGKSIVSIERLQDGVISRAVAVSQAVTTPANDPNTVIEGFDNNAAQTITIKIQ